MQQQSSKPSATTMLGFAGSRAPRIPSHQQYEGHLDQAIPKQEIELQFPPSIRWLLEFCWFSTIRVISLLELIKLLDPERDHGTMVGFHCSQDFSLYCICLSKTIIQWNDNYCPIFFYGALAFIPWFCIEIVILPLFFLTLWIYPYCAVHEAPVCPCSVIHL